MPLIEILTFSGAGLAIILALVSVVLDRHSWSRLLFAMGLILLAADAAFMGLSLKAQDPVTAVTFQRWRHAALALAPCIWLAFALTYARGDKPQSLRNWSLTLIALLVFPFILFAFHNNGLFTKALFSEEGQLLALDLGWTGYVIHLNVGVGSVLILMHLERTFRTSIGTARWRIKFMLIGSALVWAAMLYTSSQALVFRAIEFSIQGINAIGLILGCLLMLRTILRTGHFETDLYPSSSVVYGSATLLLAGLYLFVVGILAKVVSFLGGDAGFTLKALLIMVGLVGIALLVQSDRIRVMARHFASRHLQRPLHDYRGIWQRVTEATARATTVEQLGQQLVELVATVFEAHSVTLWSHLEGGTVPALQKTASTAKIDRESALESIEDPAVLQQYKEAEEPFSFESSSQDWATVLREKTPRQFEDYHAPRIAMPLTAQDKFLGLVTIGDRIGGVPFNSQDLEILQSVGDQFAASLLNLRLSQRMADAREMEAFQTMATFFVHDLKNAISGLQLMARNLEKQFNNPEFRKDAVRAVTRSVDRIEGLIRRMTELRRQLQISPKTSDLNVLLQETLDRLGNLPDTKIVSGLGILPKTRLDPELMISVLTNLLLNASQASSDPVIIHISTESSDDTIELTVADNGPGIEEDFIRDRLFRPFQSTKKDGVGIGLFQSKMIVEAHDGRIAVESRLGVGTTFRITLPIVTA